jgi:hypothetical protein
MGAQTDSLLLDPGAELLGAQVLTPGQKVPAPERSRLDILSRLDRALEFPGIQPDPFGKEAHRFSADLEDIPQIGAQLGEGLAEGMTGAGFVAVTPEKGRELTPGSRTGGPPGQVGQKDQLLPAPGENRRAALDKLQSTQGAKRRSQKRKSFPENHLTLALTAVCVGFANMASVREFGQSTPIRGGRVTAPRASQAQAAVQYGYFVLQARATRGDQGVELAGVLENLGTGEKQAFEGCDALARLIEEWGRRSGAGP